MNDTPGTASSPAGQTRILAAPADPAPGEVVRLAGDPGATVQRRVRRGNVEFISKNHVVDTPLPEGYPAPTPPGTIELKKYPSIRRAEFVSSSDGTGLSRGGREGFWPLFSHIKRRDIEMTAPVEMDWKGMQLDMGEGPQALGAAQSREVSIPVKTVDPDDKQWTMSFLYRRVDQAPSGVDPRDERVVVVDTEPVLVISAGVAGRANNRTINRGVVALRDFLAANPQWEPAGDIRGMFYNDPSVREERAWAEIQVPVRRAAQPGA